MDFALGYIAGVATCIFIAAVLVYLRKPLTQTLSRVETAISNAGPRERGFVVEPDSEAQIARQRKIAQNRAQGKDTHVSELI